MPREKYKVKNKAKDVRKFRDGFLGEDIFVQPGKYAVTYRPPEENEIWEISLFVKEVSKELKGGSKKVKDKNISSDNQ